MMTLKRGKVCGSDGLSVEFYYKFWNILSEPLMAMLKQAFVDGHLSASARRGIINLIPKGGRRNDKLVKNYRPITILNYDYKIFAKALSNRMDTVIPELVGPQQNGFIKGRSIVNNLSKTREIIAHLNRTKKAGVIAIVDFEKCFDRIEYQSIQKST